MHHGAGRHRQPPNCPTQAGCSNQIRSVGYASCVVRRHFRFERWPVLSGWMTNLKSVFVNQTVALGQTARIVHSRSSDTPLMKSADRIKHIAPGQKIACTGKPLNLDISAKIESENTASKASAPLRGGGVSSKTSTRPPIRSARSAILTADRQPVQQPGTQSASMKNSRCAVVSATPLLRACAAPFLSLNDKTHFRERCGCSFSSETGEVVVDNHNFGILAMIIL